MATANPFIGIVLFFFVSLNLVACPVDSENQRIYLAAYTAISNQTDARSEAQIQEWLTVAGPWYGGFKKNRILMSRAASSGLKISAYLPGPSALYDDSGYLLKADKRLILLRTLTERDVRSAFRDQVEQYLSDDELRDAVSVWALGTEELRPWVQEEMRLLSAAYDEIKRADPKHRPVFMYEPNNRSAAHLKISGIRQDLLVRGVYLSKFGWNTDRASVLKASLKQMRESVSDRNKPILPVLELNKDLPGYSARDLGLSTIKKNQLRNLIRHDVFLSIVEGAQGIYIWSLYPKRPHLSTYHEQLAAYGSAFIQIREISHFIPNRDINSTVSFETAESSFDSEQKPLSTVSHAQFSHCGKRLSIIVNSSHDSVTGVLRDQANKANVDTTAELIYLEPFGVKLLIE